MMFRYFLLAALLMPCAAQAAERNFGMGSFDSVRLEGPFLVEIATGKSSSAVASGDLRAIDAISFISNGTSLTIRKNSMTWGGMNGKPAGQAVIRLTTPNLNRIALIGSGDLRVDKVSAGSLKILLAGSGSISINAVNATTIDAAVDGGGTLNLAGKAETAKISLTGSGDFAATRLSTDHLNLTVDGTGTAETRAVQTAKVLMFGNGVARIAGPMACDVDNRGSSTVACGRDVHFAASNEPAPVAPSPATPPASPKAESSTGNGKTVIRHPTGVRVHRGTTPR